MINEKTFARSHGSFWHELLPMAEEYIRDRNKELGRFSPPLGSIVPAGSRALVNEAAFRLYAASWDAPDLNASDERLTWCIEEAVRHIEGLRQHSRVQQIVITGQAADEVKRLAVRLREFFRRAAEDSLVLSPKYPGCGWLDDCIGDALGRYTIFEVKAGARAFRGADLRQVLCYCALNFASKVYDIRELCLVNPREGVFLHDTLQEVCGEVAGRSPVEIFSDIVEYISEPIARSLTE